MPPLPKGEAAIKSSSRPRAKAFAAGCVVLTTLLSIVTLPLCALVLTALM